MNVVINLVVDEADCSATVCHDGKEQQFEAVSLNGLLDMVNCYVKRIVNEAGIPD
jgi:hypothetical protein